MALNITVSKANKGSNKWQGKAIVADCIALAKENGGDLKFVNRGKFDVEPTIENGIVYGGASKLESLAKYLAKVEA